MSKSSGHVISARDQSHLPSVENSHSHSPNADRQLHKHALFLQCGLQAFPLSGDHLILCIHHRTVSMPWYPPVSQNLGQMLLHFFQQEVKCTFPHISLLKRLFSWVRGEVLRQWQSYHMIRLFWYLHQTDPWITSLLCTMQCHELQPGSTSKSFISSSPDTSHI